MAFVTVKFVVVAFVLAAVKIVIGPVEALSGTMAERCIELRLVKVASIPLNLTAVMLIRFVPRISTALPTDPLVGEKSVMTNAEEPCTTVNALRLVAFPLGVVTVIGPVVAVTGTVAKISPARTLKTASTPLN